MTHIRCLLVVLALALTGCNAILFPLNRTPTELTLERAPYGMEVTNRKDGQAAAPAGYVPVPGNDPNRVPEGRAMVAVPVSEGETTTTRVDRSDTIVLKATCLQATLSNGTSPNECAEALLRLEGNEKFATMCATNMTAPGCVEYMKGIKPSDAPDSQFNRNMASQRQGRRSRGSDRYYRFNAADLDTLN